VVRLVDADGVALANRLSREVDPDELAAIKPIDPSAATAEIIAITRFECKRFTHAPMFTPK
jgi:hypothetical protein